MTVIEAEKELVMFAEQEELRSNFSLVAKIFSSSWWLLRRTIKMIWILNREMLVNLWFRRTRSQRSRYVYNHYSVWFVDLKGLIQEEMGSH